MNPVVNENPGWYKPGGARKPHWFSGDTSICLRWSLIGGAHFVSGKAIERSDGCKVCNRRAFLYGDIAGVGGI